VVIWARGKGKGNYEGGRQEHKRKKDPPDMRNIIKLSSNIMQQLRSSKSMSSLDLRTEMSEDNDSWHLRSNKDGSD
jgi:hypothetical protein